MRRNHFLQVVSINTCTGCPYLRQIVQPGDVLIIEEQRKIRDAGMEELERR